MTRFAGLQDLRAQSACDIAWSPTVTVAVDSSVPTLPGLSISDGTVHLLWYGIDTTLDVSLAGSGLRYARRPAGADTFSTPVTLLPATQSLPGYLASSGELVFVTSPAFLDTFFGMVLFRSTDGGATWSDAVPVLANAYPELIFTLDSVVLIEYLDIGTNLRGLLRSTDGGNSWETISTRFRELSDVTRLGDELHAVGPTQGSSQLEAGYYVSSDSGSSWFGPVIVSPEDIVRSASPRIALIDPGYLFATWIDTGTVMIRGSRNRGLSWGLWESLAQNQGDATVDIAADGGYVFVVWGRDIGDSNGIRGRLSVDEGETFCSEMTPGGGPGAREPVTLLSDSTLSLAWVDHSGASSGVFFREGGLHGGGGIVEQPPTEYSLAQSYPNPTNGLALIGFDVPSGAGIELELYNVLGERIMVVAEGEYAAGRYVVPVNVSGLPSGVYFYRLTAPGFDSMKKMMVLR